ncbi:PhnA protein-like protein [Skermanella stibiiresistens SB22]|uniref:PhnA protein-like protein n=1 Tax=Skermanella stibiiresistens SB22 TaxID=1385369 RepID=W9H3R0_9PROT|nr:hypothetical protein [Skermanella stibiiresistens]EWY39367.1 PhnA protein-like protein [Skermanella stibiiresistens SB22]
MTGRRYQDTYGSWGGTAAPLAPAEMVEQRRIAWSAVFAGVVVAVSLNLVLAVLGIGIGLTTIDPATADSPQASTLGIAATIWWIVTALASLAVGGWVAGRMAGMSTRIDGALHGLITWGIATLLVFWLLTSAVGTLIGGTFSVVGDALSSAAQGAAQTTDQADPNALQGIQEQARQMLAPEGGSLPQASLDTLNRVMRGDVSQEELQSTADRLAEQAGIPPEQARQTVENLRQQYTQAAEQARQTAQVAAETVSKAALWSFVALVLGAIAASIGGMFGAPAGWDRY